MSLDVHLDAYTGMQIKMNSKMKVSGFHFYYFHLFCNSIGPGQTFGDEERRRFLSLYVLYGTWSCFQNRSISRSPKWPQLKRFVAIYSDRTNLSFLFEPSFPKEFWVEIGCRNLFQNRKGRRSLRFVAPCEHIPIKEFCQC